MKILKISTVFIVTLVLLMSVIFTPFVHIIDGNKGQREEKRNGKTIIQYGRSDSDILQREGEYWGVFIGIADYNGTAGDVGIHEGFLRGIYDSLLCFDNWDKNHTKLLLNDEATIQNILEAFDWLRKNVKPDDTVFFSYIGHGTKLPDDDGDEEDGYDEALVSWELTPEACMTDDELNRKFDEINALGISIILDCCHCGEFIDSGKINKWSKCSAYDLNNFASELKKDIQVDGRVILSSAYGDSLALATSTGSLCNMFLVYWLDKNSLLFQDGVITTEELFQAVKYSIDSIIIVMPFLAGLDFALIGGAYYLRVGQILTDIINFTLFKEGFIRGYIFGFSLMLIEYMLLQIQIYEETGYWALIFPQIYDGYEGTLNLAFN